MSILFKWLVFINCLAYSWISHHWTSSKKWNLEY